MTMFGTVRWTVVALLFLGGMINYLDRSAISVAAPFLTQQLSLSPSELGSVDAIRECGLFAKLITYRVFSFSGAARDSSARPFILVSRR